MPRRYPRAVQRIEQEEFARGHIAPGETPVDPRPAATVVLARRPIRKRPGFQVLLLRRPETASFAAGAYVFPGGVLDPADGAPSLRARLARPEVSAAPEAAALAAGIRELFEETGILPADEPLPSTEARRAREALLEDRVSLARVAEDLDLSFERLRTVYFGRWITPELLARRYDTRFFLIGPGRREWSEPELTPEHTAYLWEDPGGAVQRFQAGELPMLFPTWKTLERLARYSDLETALAELATARVDPVRPRLVVEAGWVHPVLPGDPGYSQGR